MNIVKNTESSSIVVQWDEVDDSFSTTYVITWTSERDNIKQSHGLVGLTSYTIIITGLTLETVYIITVTAVNRCGQGPEYISSVSLTTDTTSATSSSAVIASFSVMSISSPTTTTTVMDSSTIITNSVTSVGKTGML